ncbi:MAG: hypothetical protein M0Q42_11485 [Xanthomonadales bacterium]|nr:hypothetical protein [Xanthomonadales bacterium]
MSQPINATVPATAASASGLGIVRRGSRWLQAGLLAAGLATAGGCQQAHDMSGPIGVSAPALTETAFPLDSGPAGTVTAPAGSGLGEAVQEHARGVFFDWRPVRAQAQRLAQDSRPHASQLQRFEIVDSAGFGQAMPALHINLPAGWRKQAKVEWDSSALCFWYGPQVHLEATSADGLHGITVLPTMAWQIASMPVDQFDPCPTAPMATVRDYLDYLVLHTRPGAQILSYRDRPDLSRPNAQFPRHAGEVLLAYTLQGHPMRESLVAAITLTRLAPGGYLVNADLAMALRAPDGLLDFAIAEQVRSSMTYTEQWQQHYMQWVQRQSQEAQRLAQTAIQAWHERRMNQINLAGMTARHNIRMDTIAEIGRINTGIVNNRAASNERSHTAFIDAIQEVQPWHDPASGQQVELSMHYRHAWQLNDGRQFLTNDPDFEPGRDLGIAGHQLQPMR